MSNTKKHPGLCGHQMSQEWSGRLALLGVSEVMRLVLMVSQGKKISRSNYNPLLGPGPRDNFWDAVGSIYGRSGIIRGTGGCF